MNPRHSPEWLRPSVAAVRDAMVKRLKAASLEPEAKRAIETALAALDVTRAELEAEVALLMRESERYAEYFEFAPDAYLITDAGGGIREANQACLELLSSARDDIVGRPLSEFIADEDRVNFLARTVGLMLGGSSRPVTWQARLQRRGGEACSAEFSVRSIALKKSGVGGLCWLIRRAP